MSGTKVIVNGDELKYKSQYDLDINVVGSLENTKFLLELELLDNMEIKIEFDKATVEKIKERCTGFLEGFDKPTSSRSSVKSARRGIYSSQPGGY